MPLCPSSIGRCSSFPCSRDQHVVLILVKSIPGDPVRTVLGTKSTPEAWRNLTLYGLDQPLLTPYLFSLKNLLDRRNGRSIIF